MIDQVVAEAFSSPSQSTTGLLEHGVPRLTVGELFAQIVDGMLLSSGLILLSEYATHGVFQHSQVHDQRSTVDWWDQNWWF